MLTVEFMESSMDIIEKRSKVVPNPRAAPIIAIVQAKNFLPKKVTTTPKQINIGAKM